MKSQKRMNQSNKKNRSRGQRILNDGNSASPFQDTRLPMFRPLSLVVPDKMFTRLKWSGTAQTTIAVGSVVTSKRYVPTSAFDVDPALGSTAMPGFNELANLYRSYRVPRSNMRLEVVSADARPFSAVLLPLNVDPTSSPSAATVQSWTMNPYSQYKLVPGVGAPIVKLSSTMSTEKIFGSKAVYFDDNFASLISTVPVNNWYWAFGFIAPVAVVSTVLTIDYTVVLELDIEFFNRTELLV